MSQEMTPEPETSTNAPPSTPVDMARLIENHARHGRRYVPFAFSTRYFEGAAPKIGRVLGLRSESATKKSSYDNFLEKLGTCIMTELKVGQCIVEVTTQMDTDIIGNFETPHKPEELADEEKQSSVEREIKKEEIKDCVKDLKIIKSNLKKTCTMVFVNCTDGVKTML